MTESIFQQNKFEQLKIIWSRITNIHAYFFSVFEVIQLKCKDHKYQSFLADFHAISKEASYHLNIELQKTWNLQIKD